MKGDLMSVGLQSHNGGADNKHRSSATVLSDVIWGPLVVLPRAGNDMRLAPRKTVTDSCVTVSRVDIESIFQEMRLPEKG